MTMLILLYLLTVSIGARVTEADTTYKPDSLQIANWGFGGGDTAKYMSVSLIITDSIKSPTTSAWTSFKFVDTVVANLSGRTKWEWGPSNDSTKLVIKVAGLYLVGYNTAFFNNGSNTLLTILTRVTKNSSELTCLGAGDKKTFATGVGTDQKSTSLVYCNANDTLVVQYWVNDADVIFTNQGNFDNRCALDFWITRIQ